MKFCIYYRRRCIEIAVTKPSQNTDLVVGFVFLKLQGCIHLLVQVH